MAKLVMPGTSHSLPLLRRKRNLQAETKRQPEYFVEMRLVTMPSNSNAGMVFRAKNLFLIFAAGPPIGFDFRDHRRQPFRDLLGFLKPAAARSRI